MSDALKAEPSKSSAGARELINRLRAESFAYFGDNIDEAEKDSIDYLTLLDRNANSALNNAIAPEKRKMIRRFDQEGRFIPVGTSEVYCQ